MRNNHKFGHLPVKMGYYFFAALVLLGIVFSLYQLAGALIASLIISFLLAPLVTFAENRGINRIVVVLLVYILVAGILLLLVMFIGPILSTEISRLSRELPEYEKQLETVLVNLQNNLAEKLPALQLPDLYPYLKGLLFSGNGFDLGSLLSRLSGLFSVLMILVIVPFVTFFFIVDGHLIQKSILRIVPNRYFEMCVLLLNRTGNALQSFIRGQLIDALYVGVMTTIGMAAIGLPYFLVIGMFAGLGNLIPYLGPIIGFIPAFFIALLTPGWFTAGNILLIAGIFLVVQLTESAFVYPIAVGKSVNLHPLIVFLGITIGGRLGGIVGMLIAVPMISIVKVILETSSSYLKSYRII
ncbi:MAG: AI-2E family transporter [Spirochaetales bacterium]|jgi:putative permease|nr:AI-2E family transporter [Spirochaetales bacterium]